MLPLLLLGCSLLAPSGPVTEDDVRAAYIGWVSLRGEVPRDDEVVLFRSSHAPEGAVLWHAAATVEGGHEYLDQTWIWAEGGRLRFVDGSADTERDPQGLARQVDALRFCRWPRVGCVDVTERLYDHTSDPQAFAALAVVLARGVREAAVIEGPTDDATLGRGHRVKWWRKVPLTAPDERHAYARVDEQGPGWQVVRLDLPSAPGPVPYEVVADIRVPIE